MGKRKGTLLSLTSLLFAFMLTTLFFYMVYNTHFDSATDDFTGLIVNAPFYENGTVKQQAQKFDAMKEALLFGHPIIMLYSFIKDFLLLELLLLITQTGLIKPGTFHLLDKKPKLP